jgi:hypothetical protein
MVTQLAAQDLLNEFASIESQVRLTLLVLWSMAPGAVGKLSYRFTQARNGEENGEE